jgi:tellurite methyltransferase
MKREDFCKDAFGPFYKQSANYFGDNPSDGLVDALEKYQIKKGKALDIGAGEGRNSLYLAKLGFSVTAVEPSILGAEKIRDRAKISGLGIQIVNTDYLSFDSDEKYDFILAGTSLDHMEARQMDKIFLKLKKSLNKGGIVYIVVFTEDDPGAMKKYDEASECANFIKHYFKKGELRGHFEDFQILFYDEYQKKDTTHGPVHFHGKAKLIAQKSK